MAPSTSSARGSASRGLCAPAWVLLDRVPHAADLDPAGTGSEADVVLQLVAPPGVSTAFVDRSLLPDDNAARSRVHGADASGRLLFSFPPPRAPGDSHLAVCRPVPGSRGDTAKGKASAIPAFPEEEFGHALTEATPTGILFDPEAKGGDGFFVAQMKSTPPVAAALLFSSDANGWSVAEVPTEDRWHGFRASSVVSHDHGDSAGFAFVDLRRRGLLLLHPRRLAAARFIELPVPEGGGGGEAIDEGQATVDYSDGRLVFVVFKEVDEGTLVQFWSLSDEERRWWSHSHISSDEVFGRDSRVWPLRLRVPPVLGPLDPNLPTRIIFGDGTFSAFFLDVTPDEMGMLRVSPRALDSVVCHIPPPPKSTWTEAMTSAVEQGKHAGMLLFGALQKGRPYADSLPAVVQLVGTTLSLPHTAVALTAARAIQTVNNYFTISEYASAWFWKNRPGAPGVFTKVVSSLQEAEQARQEWRDFGKPGNMMVDPAAEGLSQEDWNAIRNYLKANGAASLVQHHEWEMVGRPPN